MYVHACALIYRLENDSDEEEEQMEAETVVEVHTMYRPLLHFTAIDRVLPVSNCVFVCVLVCRARPYII